MAIMDPAHDSGICRSLLAWSLHLSSETFGDASIAGWIIRKPRPQFKLNDGWLIIIFPEGPLLMQSVLSSIVGRLSDVLDRKCLATVPPPCRLHWCRRLCEGDVDANAHWRRYSDWCHAVHYINRPSDSGGSSSAQVQGLSKWFCFL